MNVACPECRSVYRLDPAKITSVELRARCSVCGAVIPVGATVRWAEEFGEPRVTPNAPSGAIASHEPQAADTHPGAAAASPGVSGSGRPITPPFSSPSPWANAGVSANPRSPRHSPPRLTPIDGGMIRDAGPPPTPRSSSPAFGAPLAPPPRQPPLASVPGDAHAGTVPPDAGGSSAAGLSSGLADPPRSSARPPINPFLANDPNQKARRLARALVSDMVAYHPSKREEGLRGGTLKQLFREEIKKSYEEYVEQIGRDFAESSTHFQDALNDVLAGGRKIF